MSLFCRTQRKIFWIIWETEQFWGTIDFHSIFLCSAEQRHSYRFGTTWGWDPFNHTSHYSNINWIGPRMILKEYFWKKTTLYYSQIIVDVHDFILGWTIVYLSARLSFCPYALYRELIIAIDCAFSFLSNKKHFKLIDATLFIPEVGFYMNCFRLLSWIGRKRLWVIHFKSASLRARSFLTYLL